MIRFRLGSASRKRTGARKRIELITTLAAALVGGGCLNVANASPQSTSLAPAGKGPLAPHDISDVENAFKSLINAENAKDSVTVDRMIWNSPSTLLVDKLEKVRQGEWPGTWGYEAVRQRLHGVIAAKFLILPDYPKLKVVSLTTLSSEAYAPVEITTAEQGQQSKTYPVLMIVDWIKTPQGWRMASNIAIPFPHGTPP